MTKPKRATVVKVPIDFDMREAVMAALIDNDRETWTPFRIAKLERITCDCCDSTATHAHPEGGLRCDECPMPEER